MENKQWRVKGYTAGGTLIIEVVLKSLHSLTLEVGILAKRPDAHHIDIEIENVDAYGRLVH